MTNILKLIAFFFAFLFCLTGNCLAAVLKVTMFDVGQGDSFLIQTESENIVIDTSQKRVPYEKFGVSHIDKLILTHPHADHIGAAASLIKDGFVSHIYDNGRPSASLFYRNYISQARKMHVPISTLREGDILSLNDGAFIHILNSNNLSRDLNDDSIVCKLVYKDFSMLFTGDLTQKREPYLLNHYNLKSTVLKAAHHGSRFSSSIDFIRAVNPQFVFISASPDNHYSHPHPQTIDNLLSEGVDIRNIFCTAFNGSVTLTTDGFITTIAPQFKVVVNSIWHSS